MESADLQETSDRRVSPDASEVSPSSPGGPRPLPPAKLWAMVLVTAVVAGLLSWGAIEATRDFFKPRLFEVHLPDGSTSMQPSLESQKHADTRNTALVFAIQGGFLALAMGLVGGLASHSPARGLVVGLFAQVAGAAAGALTASFLFPILFRDLVPNPNDLLTPLLIQAGIWMAIGAVGGLALALGLGAFRRVPDALWGSLLGAFLAAGFYRLLHGVLSPASGPMVLVATDPTGRLIAAFCLAVLVTAGAAKGALGPTERPVYSAPAA